jgi:hypothetical protein
MKFLSLAFSAWLGLVAGVHAQIAPGGKIKASEGYHIEAVGRIGAAEITYQSREQMEADEIARLQPEKYAPIEIGRLLAARNFPPGGVMTISPSSGEAVVMDLSGKVLSRLATGAGGYLIANLPEFKDGLLIRATTSGPKDFIEFKILRGAPGGGAAAIKYFGLPEDIPMGTSVMRNGIIVRVEVDGVVLRTAAGATKYWWHYFTAAQRQELEERARLDAGVTDLLLSRALHGRVSATPSGVHIAIFREIKNGDFNVGPQKFDWVTDGQTLDGKMDGAFDTMQICQIFDLGPGYGSHIYTTELTRAKRYCALHPEAIRYLQIRPASHDRAQ